MVGGGVPDVHGRHVVGVPQPQVVVGDPLAPGEEAEDELLRLQMPVTVGTFKPLQAGLGRPLETLHVGAALLLVGLEHLGKGAVFQQQLGEGDGVLHGELGPRAHREVGGVYRVTHQHHVVVGPAPAADGGETQPLGVVPHQGVAVEVVGEQLLA